MEISPHRLRAIALHFGLSGDAPAAEIVTAIKKYPRTWEWLLGGPQRLSLQRGDEEMAELLIMCEGARWELLERQRCQLEEDNSVLDSCREARSQAEEAKA